jgi:divalent metal cation (Fe/Co/Zn/Cd) transporter
MQNSALGNLGRRVLAWVVIAAVVVLAIKLVVGAVFGFITMIFTLALIAVAIVGVMWAVRHL